MVRVDGGHCEECVYTWGEEEEAQIVARRECDCKTRISLEIFFKNPLPNPSEIIVDLFCPVDEEKKWRVISKRKPRKKMCESTSSSHWELMCENFRVWVEVQWKFGAAIRLKGIVITIILLTA